ncbi:MAG: NifU family protein [Flavobacteriales bacterium]
MSVHTETTTVPNILKFVNDKILTKNNFEFSKLEDTSNSPLAKTLLQFPFIQKVYIAAHFIAIEKTDAIQWEDVVDQLETIINDAIVNNNVFSSTSTTQIPISIYTEITPNPEVMKFVANKILVKGMIEFKSKEEASNSPIANHLFSFPFIKELFITENYIAITKNDSMEWNEISLELRDKISELLKNGISIINEKDEIKNQTIKNNSNLTKKYTSDEKAIKALLDEYVKPAVIADGGNIELIAYSAETKTVQVLLQGACSGCPSSTITLKNGIETLLKQFFSEKIENVEAVNG